MQIPAAARMSGVRYDIRGPIQREAERMEAQGIEVLRLNIGNPAPFGFEAPPEVAEAVSAAISKAHGYSHSKGVPVAREALARYYTERGLADVDVDYIYLGNGASELIQVSLQGLLDPGDEVLVPAPDYPLWTAAVSLCGARAVHYRCDEAADWQPDVADLASKITPRTRALVVINPNNPTGAVYGHGVLTAMVELARRNGLVLFSDEIYDRILYDGARHTHLATLAPDLLCLTFNGLSKAHRVAGYRSGWMVVTGPRQHAQSYLEALDTLASMRLCPNVPPQYAIEPSLRDPQSIVDLVAPAGRLALQRDTTWRLLNEIPGVSCVKPKGALYAFPRIDLNHHRIIDDQRFVLDLLRQERVLVVAGTGFNWSAPDHFRIVTLPSVGDLTDAIGRLGRFLASYHQ